MSIRPFRDIKRRITKVINVGNVKVGGNNPISVQSMTNTLTKNVKETLTQINKISEVGGDIVRVSCPDEDSTNALKEQLEGIEKLAQRVVEITETSNSDFNPIYPDDMDLLEKINTIAREIYGAAEAAAPISVLNQLKQWEKEGYGNLPVCMAKTQYSFSTDPERKGAPKDHVINIREVRLSAGAEFIVVICGAIMTMPGLPKVPAADSIKLNNKNEVEGLF